MKIIIITGLPATGKSTLAKKIAKKLKYEIISKDSIQEQLFEKYGFKTHEEKMVLNSTADSIFYKTIENAVKNNTNIVIDKYVRDWSFFDELFIANHDIKAVHLDCDIDKIMERYHNRTISNTRPLCSRVYNVYPYEEGVSKLVPDLDINELNKNIKNSIESCIIPTLHIDTSYIESNEKLIMQQCLDFFGHHQKKEYDFVVVGAGLSGITIAERLANGLNKNVLIIEKQKHIGGACYDSINEVGLLIGNYGPHTFHTNDKEVFDYINNFCEWHEYYHHAKSYINGKWISFPITKQTFKDLYEVDLSDEEIDDFVDQHSKEITDLFFENFTYKQWGVKREELDPSVIKRISFRKNYDTRYFTDVYQGNPIGGYTKMFNNMLSNKKIKVLCGHDYKEAIKKIAYKKMVYTGPLDYYFENAYEPLLYRSVKFIFETYKMESYQPQASARFPGNEVAYTRITEFKKMTGQKSDYTTILKEIPCFGGIEYYPYWTKKYLAIAEKYRDLSDKEKDTYFLGRLGEYKYYDMDDAVRSALDLYERIKKEQC